jgi:CheY-like chemotaxis protein
MKLMTTSTKGNGNMKKILIVDDEPDVCTVLKNVLEEYGFNADSYDDPISALENFKAGLYELLLLDIKMPEMDGFLLYQEVKKIDNKIKVCFLTASEMYHEKFREKEGFSALDKDLFLRKPIENEDLINEINRTLNTRRCKAGDKDSCRNRET